MIVRCCALLALLTAAAGCEEETQSGSTECRFGSTQVVAEVSAIAYDDLAIASTGAGAVVAASAPGGLRLLWLDASGQVARQRRIGAACSGGVAVTRSESDVVVACMRPSIAEMRKPGAVHVLRVDAQGDVVERSAHGPTGNASRGVALATTADGVFVAWQDAEAAIQRVRLIEVGSDVPSDVLSRPETLAGSPTLAVHDERLVAAFSETVFDETGAPVGEVRVWRGRGAARSAATVLYGDARPALATHGGRLVIGFHDEQPAGSKAGIYIAGLQDDGTVAAVPRRVGRADIANARAAVFECGEEVFVVSPRTFGTSEVLIGINRLDPELQSLGGERQLYEAGRRLPLADATCVGGEPIVIAAEQGNAAEPVARLRTTTLVCH